MYITLAGKRWLIRDLHILKGKWLGDCNYDKRRLAIPINGDTKAELDTIVHEVTHATCPWMEEEAVCDLAKSITTVLWKLNWRKDGND